MADEQEIDMLAGEYVLGSLTDAERVVVTSRLKHDLRLASVVADWERILSPLGALERTQTPPPAVLEGVLSAIAATALSPGGRPGEVVLLRHQVRIWRRISGALAATAATLAIVLGGYTSGPSLNFETAIAVLSQPRSYSTADEGPSNEPPLFVARLTKDPASVLIRQLGGRKPERDRIYAIWLITPDMIKATRIGTMSKTEPITITELPPGTSNSLVRLRLAISLESENGQALQQPRGPIVSIGKFEAP